MKGGLAMKRRNINLKEMAHTLGRVLRYMLKNYKGSFCVVVVCTLVSALCTLSGTLFLQSLIDDYILPLTQSAAPDFGPLGWALAQMACVYALGILSSYGYNRIMVNISQGTMRNLRDDLFTHMESLPIQYFDTHAHGDIMSVYTNDVDTLRQVISQTIPQMINSLVTMVITLVSLFVLDVPLTLLTIAMLCVMLFVSSKIAGRSAVYFAKQQKDLGAVNGYIEEMMAGQKVVKVFCHEEKSLEDFRQLNQSLRDSADKANTFANIAMPVNGNLGNISYVLCAAVGALLALSGHSGLTLGTLVAFLNLNKNATQPVSQISQQTNSIVMAMAGAQRVFDLIDAAPETDNGYVELVNAKEDRDGNLVECAERTNVWAWKHPPPGGRHGHLHPPPGGRDLRRRGLWLRGGENRPAQHQAVRHARAENRLCGLHRRGQDHHYQPYQPLLRHRRRQNPLRWHQHQQD